MSTEWWNTTWQSVLAESELIYLLLTAVASFIIARQFIPYLSKVASRTRNNWDDILVRHGALNRMVHLLPAILLATGLPWVLPDRGPLFDLLTRINNIYFILAGFLLFDALLSTGMEIYQSHPSRQGHPIRGVVQFLKLIVFLVCFILILSQLANRSPLFFLSGLGAMTAILLLIFKDTLLGLVAGVQITTMDLVRQGDWIEMPKHGADGDVIDVSLTTVRVQNWDRTITSIPAYEMVSSSFKNWRGMTESGGRRIKRAILIDIETIRFLDENLLARLRTITLLRPYLEQKAQEITAYNEVHVVPEERSALGNGRRLTNLGTFRAYCEAYLKAHPHIHRELTFLIRQLNPTAQGLPLEIYVFVNDTRWGFYEGVQSDIFDHLYAVLPEFGLRAFQEPSGAAFRALGSGKNLD